MIEVTQDGEKLMIDIDSIYTEGSQGKVVVSQTNSNFEWAIDESYDEIKALLRQKRVNDLAEKLLVGLMASVISCNDHHRNGWSDANMIEFAFIQANAMITEQEKHNGN